MTRLRKRIEKRRLARRDVRILGMVESTTRERFDKAHALSDRVLFSERLDDGLEALMRAEIARLAALGCDDAEGTAQSWPGVTDQPVHVARGRVVL